MLQPPIDTQAIRADFGLFLAVAGRDVPLKQKKSRKGDYWAGPCPFCQAGEDRFKVFKNTGLFNCRHCGRKGDVLEYVQFKQGLDFIGAAKWLGSVDTAAAPQPVHTAAQPAMTPDERAEWSAQLEAFIGEATIALHDPGAEQARAWLLARGISPIDWAKFGIGWNDHWRRLPGGDRLPPGILLPRFDVNREAVSCGIYYAKESRRYYENSRHGHIGPKQAAFFNALRLKQATTVIILEGELDAVLLDKFLSTHVIPVASGGDLTIPHDLTPLEDRRVLICMDNDAPGQAAIPRWLERLPGAEVAKMPANHKDITDMWKAGWMIGTWAKELLA